MFIPLRLSYFLIHNTKSHAKKGEKKEADFGEEDTFTLLRNNRMTTSHTSYYHEL
jgi:hypothetical protein